MHTSVCADDQITSGIDFCNDAGYTDRIEAFLFQVFTAVIGMQHHHDDLLAFKRRTSGHFFISINCKKDIRIRYDEYVVDGYYCHICLLN